MTTENFITPYLNLITSLEIELPSFNYLAALQKNHIEKLGWDSIDLFLGRRIQLNPQLIFEKFLNEQRGGVCYELNGAFCHLLNTLGFDAYLASAYVHGYNDDLFNFKLDTHVVIILKFNKECYLVDVGWGDSYRTPILLKDQNQFSDLSGEYQLCLKQDTLKFELTKFYKGKWRKQYDFSLNPTALICFQQTLTSIYNDPEHAVHRQLNCIKPNSRGYIAIKNNELIIKTDNHIEKLSFAQGVDAKTILVNEFAMKPSFVENYF